MNIIKNFFISFIFACVCATFGSFFHRAGANDVLFNLIIIPYGIIISFLMTFSSGVLVKLLTNSNTFCILFAVLTGVIVYFYAENTNGNYLIIRGLEGETVVGSNVSKIWLFSCFFIAILPALIPKKFLLKTDNKNDKIDQ